MSPTAEDIDLLARTIWGEARGEPLEGKVAVAHVILNRARIGGWWGDTIERVVLRRWQFSVWNRGDPNRPKMLVVDLSDSAFRDSMYAALGAVQERIPDNTEGATHYHATSITPPRWAPKLEATVTIGRHKFYRRPA